MRSALAPFCFVVMMVPLVAFSLPHGDPNVKKAMNQIYGAMNVLLPLAMDEDAFYDQKNEAEIANQLKHLEGALKDLKGRSADDHEVAFNKLRDDFLGDIRFAHTSFASGIKRHASYRLKDSVSYCLSCHSLQAAPKDGTPQDTKGGLWHISQSMDALSRVELLTMSRQFNEAIQAYEKLLVSQDLSLEDRILRDPFREYLILTVRVKSATDRAEAFLTKLEQTESSQVIKRRIGIWKHSLATINRLKLPDSFASAKKFMELADGISKYPADKSGLVYHLEASRILRALLSRNQDPKRAEIYYLLGKTELLIEDDNYRSLEYFARTIQEAPATNLARDAFGVYEEQLVFSYSGSGGTFIPDIEKSRLQKLRNLAFAVNRAAKGKPQ